MSFAAGPAAFRKSIKSGMGRAADCRKGSQARQRSFFSSKPRSAFGQRPVSLLRHEVRQAANGPN